MTVDALLPGTLTVRLLREADGAPLAGVACRLAAFDDDGAVAAEPARTGTSDDAGLLAWSWEPRGSGYELRVAGTDATVPWRQRLDAPGLVEVRVPGWAWSIEGEAVTRAGAPLAGVTVRLWWESFRSILDWATPDLLLQADAAGRFRVEHPAAGGDATFLLCATAPGWMSAHAQAGLVSPRDGPLTARLVMVPASEMAVRVVTASGAPVEAATLRASTRGEFHAGITLQQIGGPPADWSASLSRCHDVPLPAFTQRSGPDGLTRWWFTHEAWSLSVAHPPEHPPWRDEVHGAGGDVEVVLHDGVALAGLVLDGRGDPVARALVRLHARSPHAPVETDARGAFRIDAIAPADGAVLTVLGPGHELHVEGLDIAPGRDVTRRIVLADGLPLAGRVLDATGRPAAGVEVQIRSDRVAVSRWLDNARDRAAEQLALPTAVVTGADGGFRFGRLYAADYRLCVWDTGSRRLLGTGVAHAGDEAVLLVAGEGARDVVELGGAVTDVATGRPLVGALVQAERLTRSHDGQPWQLVRRTAEPPDARFLFTDLDPGVWRLSVWDARSFEAGPWAGPVAAYDAGRHEVPLRVETGASAPPVR